MSELPPLPAGYALDAPPPLPAGYKLDSVPDAPIGENRASAIAALRGIPIAGAYVDKGAAMLNAAAQPFTETGLSHAGSYAKRETENEARIKGATDQYEKENPIGTTVGKMAIGTAAMAPFMAAAPAAFGLEGTVPAMVAKGAASGAALSAADAAARGENPVAAAATGGIIGGAAGPAGRLVGKGVSAIADRLRPEPPRIPRTIDINGNEITVPESHVNPDNLVGSQEQQAISGALGPEAQRVAQAANEATHAQTQAAAHDFGDQMRGGPGPSRPQADKLVAAEQTITELAQQHNDQIAAQARQEALAAAQAASHDAQITAEGASLRHDVNAPLGAPEPAQPHAATDAVGHVQEGIQEAARAAQQNVTARYRTAGQFPGEYSPAAFSNVGNSVRNLVERAPGSAGQRVTINPALTPHANAMLDLLDNHLGQNYYENALSRGDMIRTPDGRVVARPLTPADTEAARQEMVSHLRDARSAARAPGGSGTDAYAAQRVMDAFNTHHARVLNTPGAFSGDGPAYLQAIDAARAAHAQRRATFSNQANGDTVGPVVERIIGRHDNQQMPVGDLANKLYGTPTNPGGGNSLAIMQRARQIVGPDSSHGAALRQGVIPHLISTPEGAPELSTSQQASRLLKYAATPHAADLLGPEGVARIRAHAADLLIQARPAPPPAPSPVLTTTQRAVTKLATEGNASDVIQKAFAKSGEINAGAEHLIQEVKNRVSQPTFNSIRQAMWQHLLEKPEGMVEWGPRELSNRISRFLESPASKVMYDTGERGVMRQFQQHYAKLAPLPNTANSSGSAVMGAKLVRSMGNHIGAMLGSGVGGALGGPIVGHLAGAAIGEGIQRVAAGARTGRQVAMTKDLFLGQKPARPVKPVYSSKVARLIAQSALNQQNQKQSQP